jgi:hypothetical protein
MSDSALLGGLRRGSFAREKRVRQGASESELAEAMGVVVLMNGGRGTPGAPRAPAAY